MNLKNLIGDTPLHIASLKGRGATVAQLCKLGANTTLENKFQCTPLENSILAKDSIGAKCLLENGANPDALVSGGDGQGLNMGRSLVDLARASGISSSIQLKLDDL